MALARGLEKAGHSVCLATLNVYRDVCVQAGFDFLSLEPDLDKDDLAAIYCELARTQSAKKQLAILAAHYGPSVSSNTVALKSTLEDFDLFVVSDLQYLFWPLGDQNKVPTATLLLSHQMVPCLQSNPFNTFSHREKPTTWQRILNRFSWYVANRLSDLLRNRAFGKTLRKAGLDGIKDFVTRPAHKALVAVSPHVADCAKTCSSHFRFVGYLRWQPKTDVALMQRVKDFCGKRLVPILTFGSASTDEMQTRLKRCVSRWPKDKKIILQTGWRDLGQNVVSDNILIVPHASHDALFACASCVVHHGGAGTTASVMFAGKPHVVIPHAFDQPFWSAVVEQYDLGLKLAPEDWPEKLQEALNRIENTPHFSKQSEALASRMRSDEDAENNATRELEQLVQTFRRKKG